MNCSINYVLVGERDKDLLSSSITSVRKYCNYDINVLVDENVSKETVENLLLFENISIIKFNRLKYHTREENRNSSLFRLIALREASKKYDISLYLDNDILIVHKGFLEGFKISKHFGFCMALNPRTFITTYEKDMGDIDVGWDVLPYDHAYVSDMPNYMSSYNMGVMFYNRQHFSSFFLGELIHEQSQNPSRGQAGLYRTMWKCKFAPYSLTRNWLVCHQDVDIKRPLAVHFSDTVINEKWKEE